MNARSPRNLARSWIPASAVSSPLGGGLIKLGHGSTWAAVSVGLAPYLICALLYALFAVGYLTAIRHYPYNRPTAHKDMERLIQISAGVVVEILTLTSHSPIRQAPGKPGPEQ